MRRTGKEITDAAEFERILRNGTIVRFAMVIDSEPYVIPLAYGYENGTLFVHCAPEGRKLPPLRAGDKICFEVETPVHLIGTGKPCAFSFDYGSVIGWGRCRELVDEEERNHGLKRIVTQSSASGEEFDFRGKMAGMAVFALTIEKMTGKRSQKQAAYRRKHQSHKHIDHDDGRHSWLLADHPSLGMEYEIIPPGGSQRSLRKAAGANCVYVLAGNAEIDEPSGKRRLHAGESAIFEAEITYAVRNSGETELEFVVASRD